MEKTRKPDRRIAKTKKALKRAFISLLTTKEFTDITVKEVADMADVDRKTLYNYYNGTYQILEEIENDFIKLLEDSVIKLDFENNIKNPLNIFEKITEVLNENIDLYQTLMKLDSNSQIVLKMINSLTLKVKEVLIKYSDIESKYNIDVVSKYVTSGLISIYQDWFNSDNKTSLEELSKQAGMLVLYGIEGLKK